MRYKKPCLVAVMFVIFGMVIFCFYSSIHAKQDKKEITVGTSYYREFGMISSL